MWLYIKTTQDKEKIQSTLAVSATSMLPLSTELYFNVCIPRLVKAQCVCGCVCVSKL